MTRILLRSGKDAFKVVSAENTLQTNLMGSNSGNLLFSTAAMRLLASPGVEIVSNGLGANPVDEAERINDEYDMFVLPFANAFRPRFRGRLERFTNLIERLRIPVVVMSCGAQASVDYGFDALSALDATVTRFAKAVLARSASIAVRGEFTEAYLQRLGFFEVEVTGCPSMFLFGEQLTLAEKAELTPASRIAVNASSTDSSLMGPIITRHAERFPGLHYIAQDRRELERLLWTQSAESCAKAPEFPMDIRHPLNQRGGVLFFLDPWRWIDELRSFAFSFGTRAHGNIAALLAGVPSVVLAHDSRTLELARYFEIPYRRLPRPDPELRAEELYEQADFVPLVSNHRARAKKLAAFLERNGLDHTLGGDSAAAFEERLRSTPYPPPVRPAAHASAVELAQRVRWLRSRHTRQIGELQDRVAALEKQLDDLRSVITETHGDR